MSNAIENVEVIPVAIPRETPYLGPLESGLEPNEKGYFIRPGNESVYSVRDQSVLVKATDSSGAVGWGECVGFVAPQAAAAILEEVVAPLVLGRDPHDAPIIYEDLYNAMRVRGFFGGFYNDALAALDMALWDLKGKLTGLPLHKLLGAKRVGRIPAYVSGLPGGSREERAVMARDWMDRGFSAVKFAAAIAHDGVVEEMKSIREAIGPDPKILVDMHWRNTSQEAIRLISALEEYDLYLAEAPVHPEDAEGQAHVVRAVKTPVGIGEELRTVYEYRPRFMRRCMSVIQPEMGRMGVTSFVQVCQMSRAFHCKVMPHASIGIGIFQAASLQVSATLSNMPFHEYQHSVFDRNLRFLNGTMGCEAGYFDIPEGPGLGVDPTEEILSYALN